MLKSNIKTTKIGLVLAVSLMLTGCDSGPSATEIKTAANAEPALALFNIEVTDIEKHKCVEATEGRYRCTYKATIKNKATNQINSGEESSLFEKRGDTWVAVKG